jgi:hypothetical protein
MQTSDVRRYLTKSRSGHYKLTLVHKLTRVKVIGAYGHSSAAQAMASEYPTLLATLAERVAAVDRRILAEAQTLADSWKAAGRTREDVRPEFAKRRGADGGLAVKNLNLAQYTVTLTFPDGWGDAEADAACNALDELDVIDTVRQAVKQAVASHKALQGVRVVVED